MQNNQQLARTTPSDNALTHSFQGLSSATILMPLAIPDFTNLDEVTSLHSLLESRYETKIAESSVEIAAFLQFALQYDYITCEQLNEFIIGDSHQHKANIVNAALDQMTSRLRSIGFQYNSENFSNSINALYDISLDKLGGFNGSLSDKEGEPVLRVQASTIWQTIIQLDVTDSNLARLTYCLCQKILNKYQIACTGEDIIDSDYFQELYQLQKYANAGFTGEQIKNKCNDFSYIIIENDDDLEYHLDRLSLLDVPEWYDGNHELFGKTSQSHQQWFEFYQKTALCLNPCQHYMLAFCQKAIALLNEPAKSYTTDPYEYDQDYYHPLSSYHILSFGFGSEVFGLEEVEEHANSTGEVGYLCLVLAEDCFDHVHDILIGKMKAYSLINFLEEMLSKAQSCQLPSPEGGSLEE